MLKGPILMGPVTLPPSSHLEPTPPNVVLDTPWFQDPPPATSFSPPLPSPLSLHLTLISPSLHLTVRVLEPTSQQQHTFTKLAFAIGAQRRLEHDEMDELFMYDGEEVRVKEKVRVESAADPGLLSLGAKLGQLERVVEAVRGSLGCVMGVEVER